MVVLSIHSILYAQVNIESVARLHFTIESEPNKWIEGYQSYIEGTFSPYQSHRSGQSRDSAFVARTSGSESMFAWNTAPIPQSWKGDSASFIWVCGFGNNLGNEWFDLTVNDADTVTFSTKNESAWTVKRNNGIRLSFTAVAQNSYGANLGYMVLALHRSKLTKGKSLKLRIRGREVKEEIWYRLYAYRDALVYMKANEYRNIYSAMDFIHMGDAAYTLCTSKKLSGKTLLHYSPGADKGEVRLQQDGVMSKAQITIPRNQQPEGNGYSYINIAENIVDTIKWAEINKKRIRAFMEEEIVPEKYIFPPGSFPTFRWKNEILVENELGKTQSTVTFYNKDFQKVKSAESPGRYGAVIELVTPSGFIVKRYVTLYCSPVEFDDYSANIPIKFNNLKEYRISSEQWDSYERNFEQFSFGSMKYFPQYNSDAAIFLAGLSEINGWTLAFETPRIKDRQWWITLKRKLDGISEKKNPVMLPQKINNGSLSVVNDSIVSTFSYKKEQIEQLRLVCKNWAEKGGVPHVTLIVHKGKIIFHEAFGITADGKPLATNSKMWMASITKLLTGVLMMQLVDQGIVDLDDPINRYLPEISGNNLPELTLRHLFTHTSGLQNVGEWASDWNFALDNQIAQLLPTVDVGRSFSYHRVGYAIAGKMMERITGRAVPYLFQDYIFHPIGMNSAYADNTYGGLYCSAIDLARFGQMLLNKGNYNGWKLFSEQSFEKMLPKELSVGERRWGIGSSPMDGRGLSSSAFGHGAASGTIFRIDPQNDLIIISARNSTGKFHEEFERAFIEHCMGVINN
ncbi:MAG: serine hydrolase domain-containing protein [Bacteroidota bacterium]